MFYKSVEHEKCGRFAFYNNTEILLLNYMENQCDIAHESMKNGIPNVAVGI